MKRDWKVIENILQHLEAEDINEYINQEKYLIDLGIDLDEYLGHVEILSDAGLIKRCEIVRGRGGRISAFYFNGAFITMQGHDLLDAMRDKTVWNQVKAKAAKSGIALSWEFIKAAIPEVMKDLASL